MKGDRERPAAPGPTVTKPDILAEVERGEAAAGGYGEHRVPRPRATPAGPSQGDWPGKEVKSEEGASPPPGSPRCRRAADPPTPLRGRGCSYCGAAEPEPHPAAGSGGFPPAPAPSDSRRCRPGEPAPECAECGRGSGHRPDLVRHRLAHGGHRAPHACGCCGTGPPEPLRLGAAGSPCHPAPCAGRCPAPDVGTAAAPRKERKELSLPEKVRVLEMLEGPKVSQSELAKRFGVSQPQICRIIKNKERILGEWQRRGHPERKRRREAKDAALEAALLRWVEGAKAAHLPGSHPLLQLKARHLAQALGRPETEPGGGWLARLGARRGPAFPEPLAEQGDAEQPAAERWAGAVLPGLLRSYAPCEVFACGETPVPFPGGGPGEGESGGGGGERLTLLLCVNADGSEKAPLWVVGESPQPRCLRGVNLAQMPWRYRGGGGGGVTAALFAEWLREFNEGMRQRGKSVVLLLAKQQAHPYLQLSNVRMVFIPPATALAQPLDRGIAGDLRGHYRRRLLRRLPAELGAGQPTLLDALHVLAQAWGDVSPGLISGCFRAAGFSPDAGAEGPALAPAPGVLSQEHRAPMDGELEHDGDPADGEVDGDRGTVDGGDGGEPVAVQPCPSEREVWGSLATLRRYLECRATSPEPFRAFYQLEDAVQGMAASGLAGDTLTKH